MKVNSKKTQMLCVHANYNNEISTYIRSEQGEIESGKTLKILGFNFSNEPNANVHVMGVIDKLYGKLWTLRFLKRSSMSEGDLLNIYKTVLRPSAEYSSIVYNTLIPEYISDKLETVQRPAMKIIFGYNVDFGKLVEEGKIETLKKRREYNSLKFALKAANSGRFGKLWFEENSNDRVVRPTTREKFKMKHWRTERGRNNPVSHMTKLLNEHFSK